VIAFPFAYWLARYVSKRYQKVLLILVILPFWTSYLLRVYSWLTILGPEGAINRFLHWTGATSQPVSFFLYDRPAVILVLVYLYFPFAALTLYASLERFDWNQFRAAMDLGATPATAVWRILLPQIRPGMTTAVIFVFVPILGEYLTPQLVGGARGVMIGNLIANFFQGAQYTRGAAAALLIVILIVILLAVFRRRSCSSSSSASTRTSTGRSRSRAGPASGTGRCFTTTRSATRSRRRSGSPSRSPWSAPSWEPRPRSRWCGHGCRSEAASASRWCSRS
jgi:ABC-type spermidine/putrescine transport system permease subunit I